MNFDWDTEKARTNLAKHGVSFETAGRALRDPDRHEIWQHVQGEDRWKVYCAIGVHVYVVVYSEPEDAIRIISAREANKHEQKAYFRQKGR